VVLLTGLTVDSLKRTPVSAHTYFMKADQSLKLAEYHSLDGSFTYTSPGNTELLLVIEAPGYFPKMEILLLPKLDSSISLYKEITMRPIKQGEEFRLQHLYFASGESEILSSSFPELKQLADWLLLNPNIDIEIQGHTDDVGEINDNLGLSNARALAVKKYLVERGCDEDQIKTKGYGESQPIVPNDSEENRQRNRRVMIMVLQAAK
jgi:OmpA-OmpF porin, OOP family